MSDARGKFATRERLPDADDVVVGWPAQAYDRYPPDDATYVVTLTHDARFDEPALGPALRSPVPYIGALGSRRAQETRRRRLLNAGLHRSRDRPHLGAAGTRHRRDDAGRDRGLDHGRGAGGAFRPFRGPPGRDQGPDPPRTRPELDPPSRVKDICHKSDRGLVKISRIVPALCLLACLAGGAAQPAVRDHLPCSRSAVEQAAIPAGDHLHLRRDDRVGTSTFRSPESSSGANVPSAAGVVSGNTASVSSTPRWRSAASYRIVATIDDGGVDRARSPRPGRRWPPPAHPKLSIEYILAIPDPAAVHDMLQRIDAANLFAPPTAARVIDAAGPAQDRRPDRVRPERPAGRAGGRRRRRLHLPREPRRRAGVVRRQGPRGGHRRADALAKTADWPYNSAVGQGTAWDTKWDIYGNDNLITPDRIQGGSDRRRVDLQKHFVTSGPEELQGDRSELGRGCPALRPGQQRSSPTSPKPARSAACSHLPAGVPDHPPGERLAAGRPRLPAVVIDDCPVAASIPPTAPAASLLARVTVVVDEPDRPRPTRTSPPSRRATAPGRPSAFGFAATDADLDHAGALRFRYRHRRRQVEVGGGECRGLLQPREGPSPHGLACTPWIRAATVIPRPPATAFW